MKDIIYICEYYSISWRHYEETDVNFGAIDIVHPQLRTDIYWYNTDGTTYSKLNNFFLEPFLDKFEYSLHRLKMISSGYA